MFIRRKEFDELKSSVKLYRDYAEDTLRKLNKICELLKYKPEYVPDTWSVWRDSSPAQIDLGNNLIRKLIKKAAQPEKYEVEDVALCTSKIGGACHGNYIPTTGEYKRAIKKIKTISKKAYNDHNPLWDWVTDSNGLGKIKKNAAKKKFNNKKK